MEKWLALILVALIAFQGYIGLVRFEIMPPIFSPDWEENLDLGNFVDDSPSQDIYSPTIPAENVTGTSGTGESYKVKVDRVEATGQNHWFKASLYVVFIDGTEEKVDERKAALVVKHVYSEAFGVPTTVNLAIYYNGKEIKGLKVKMEQYLAKGKITIYVSVFSQVGNAFLGQTLVENEPATLDSEVDVTWYIAGEQLSGGRWLLSSRSGEITSREVFLPAEKIDKIAISKGLSLISLSVSIKGTFKILATQKWKDLQGNWHTQYLELAVGEIPEIVLELPNSLEYADLGSDKARLHVHYPSKVLLENSNIRQYLDFRCIIDGVKSTPLTELDVGTHTVTLQAKAKAGSTWYSIAQAKITVPKNPTEGKEDYGTYVIKFVRTTDAYGKPYWHIYVQFKEIKVNNEQVPEIVKILTEQVELHTSRYSIHLNRKLKAGYIIRLYIRGKYSGKIYTKDVSISPYQDIYSITAPTGTVTKVEIIKPVYDSLGRVVKELHYTCDFEFIKCSVAGVGYTSWDKIRVIVPSSIEFENRDVNEAHDVQVIVYGWGYKYQPYEGIKVYINGKDMHFKAEPSKGNVEQGKFKATYPLVAGEYQIKVVQKVPEGGGTVEVVRNITVPAETVVVFDMVKAYQEKYKEAGKKIGVTLTLDFEDIGSYPNPTITIDIPEYEGKVLLGKGSCEQATGWTYMPKTGEYTLPVTISRPVGAGNWYPCIQIKFTSEPFKTYTLVIKMVTYVGTKVIKKTITVERSSVNDYYSIYFTSGKAVLQRGTSAVTVYKPDNSKVCWWKRWTPEKVAKIGDKIYVNNVPIKDLMPEKYREGIRKLKEKAENENIPEVVKVDEDEGEMVWVTSDRIKTEVEAKEPIAKKDAPIVVGKDIEVKGDIEYRSPRLTLNVEPTMEGYVMLFIILATSILAFILVMYRYGDVISAGLMGAGVFLTSGIVTGVLLVETYYILVGLALIGIASYLLKRE